MTIKIVFDKGGRSVGKKYEITDRGFEYDEVFVKIQCVDGVEIAFNKNTVLEVVFYPEKNVKGNEGS